MDAVNYSCVLFGGLRSLALPGEDACLVLKRQAGVHLPYWRDNLVPRPIGLSRLNLISFKISLLTFAFPALDTNSPLPLFNSLTHLTYLTSTSPRIREIMTMDGGLERLVRILHDFCMCPPSPENPMLFYGLTPPSAHPPKRVPTLNPKSFDKQAQYRFALAFQCVVNIGVRGSEVIRSRVVQAGTLDVVGCILEAWLAGRGFAVGPSVSAPGMHRETKEHRLARRQAQLEARQREQADQLARALQQQVIEPSRRLPAPQEVGAAFMCSFSGS